ncbi:MAG: twin-arginine translocation signal domain-containing protein, partial [Alistipes sp.]|nr:twin-arginine translocation signal domain-containing protein [Candidatus Minthomonas equi]
MERRDFIKMSALASAAAVTGVPYATAGNLTPEITGSAGKKDAIKVKVYFLSHLADVQDRPDWPNIGYDFRPDMIDMVRKLNAGVPEVEFIPAKANGDDNVREMLKLDAKEGIEGYVCVQVNPWNGGILALISSKKPVLYT